MPIRPLLAAAAAALPLAIPGVAAANPFEIPDSEAESVLDLGLAYLGRSSYVGSDEFEEDIFPYIAGEYKGRVFFNPAQGAGVNLINNGTLQVAALASLAGGRDAEDTPLIFDTDSEPGAVAVTDALDDLFEVDSSITAGGLATYLFKYARVDLQVMTPVTGDVEGVRTDASLTTRLPVGPAFIFPGVRATWLSDEWTETYYGLTNAQASALTAAGNGAFASGYDPDSSWTLGLQGLAYWEVIDDVNLVGAVNYSLLQGDAKDSPLATRNDGLTAVLGIAKRF